MGFSIQLKVITFLKGKAHNFETNVGAMNMKEIDVFVEIILIFERYGKLNIYTFYYLLFLSLRSNLKWSLY